MWEYHWHRHPMSICGVHQYYNVLSNVEVKSIHWWSVKQKMSKIMPYSATFYKDGRIPSKTSL